jgi:hypothetical protein
MSTNVCVSNRRKYYLQSNGMEYERGHILPAFTNSNCDANSEHSMVASADEDSE